MDGSEITKELFLRDVKEHKLTIIKDDGVYRHIKLAEAGTNNRAFEIITWPGYLAYVGDMGDYVFSRLNDMFTFFRQDNINPDYWSEKVTAESIFGEGICLFSGEAFKEAVLDDVRSQLDLEENDKIPDDIMEEIEALPHMDNEIECVSAMWNFESDKLNFDDFWEHNITRYTWYYIWACYAINWAIVQYDNTQKE